MLWSRLFRHPIKTRITLGTLTIFVIGIWSLMSYVSQMLRVDMERVLGSQQFSTVSLIAAEVNQEIVSRITLLEALAQGITTKHLDDSEALQKILEARPTLQTFFNDGVAFGGVDGTVLADFPMVPGRVGANFKDRDYILGPIQQGRVTIGKPVRSALTQSPSFVIAVPVKDTQGQVIGVLAGVIDLGKANFLDRITANTYGLTGGYLAVVPKSRLIVTATDKRRIMEELPVSGISPALDRFIQGHEGTQIFVNPLGVEVLASAKGVPAADWYMATMLPTEEAFAPIRSMQHRILLATVLLTLLAGGLIWWMLRRLLSPLLASLKTLTIRAVTNQPPEPLLVHKKDEIGDLIDGFNHLLETLNQREKALQESEELYRSVTDQGQALIWLAGLDKGCYYFNQPWLNFTGRSLQQEFGNGWAEGVHPDDLQRCLDVYLKAFDLRESFSMTYRLRHHDGQYRWILDDGAPRYDSQNQFVGFVGHCLDITEGKQAEEINTFLSQVSWVMPDERFFDALARFLAQSLQMDYVCIDRLEGDGLTATTLAVWQDGEFQSNLTYSLADTPCGEVVGKKVCCFPASVCQFFPSDRALEELHAESYVGVTLWSHSGQPIGLIAVIGKYPLKNRAHAEATLERVAIRAAAELERLQAEAALTESEARYRTLIDWTREAVAVHRAGRVIYVRRPSTWSPRKSAVRVLPIRTRNAAQAWSFFSLFWVALPEMLR